MPYVYIYIWTARGNHATTRLSTATTTNGTSSSFQWIGFDSLYDLTEDAVHGSVDLPQLLTNKKPIMNNTPRMTSRMHWAECCFRFSEVHQGKTVKSVNLSWENSNL